MEILKIIITGIIDGITGFLPVSSSGHLALLKNIFGFEAILDSNLFDIVLKLAAFFVIIIALKSDVVGIVKSVNNPSLVAYRSLLISIAVATVPTAIIAFMGRDLAAASNQTVFFPAICILITGIMLFIVNGKKDGEIQPTDVSVFSAFVIGAVQGLSVLPGLSRSALVIAACLLSGYDTKLTFKFAYLSALPAILGAVIVDIVDIIRYGADDISKLFFYILAGLFAVVTGYLGIAIVHKVIKNGRYMGFAIYCLVIGSASLASMILGI